MKYLKGSNLIVFLTCITLALWVLSKNTLSDISQTPLRSISQAFSLVGLLYMMISLILSTRIRFFEDMMGGLDKVYEAHHIIGSISFVLIMHHPLLLAIQAIPHASQVVLYLFPSSLYAYNLGVVALYIMIFSFLFMVVFKLPYHLWKRTHQMLGFAGILGGAHALNITSDIAVYMPLRYWMMGWIGVGAASFIYMLIFYYRLGSIYKYKVTRIERVLDIVNVYAQPITRKINFKPGQFAYVSFSNKGLGSEQHPFSFSSGPEDPELRFSIKMLGDYTVSIPQIKKGDFMYMKGPYGRFGEVYVNGTKPLVWIVGGIGVTPFLSMLRFQQNLLNERQIEMFYCFTTREGGVFTDEINQLTMKKKSIHVHEWCSTEKGQFSISQIETILHQYPDYDVQICGPGPMMDSLQMQLEVRGVSDDRIIFEKFQLI
ncbi:hypothetical protein COY90_03050 [Candidatus Roizmanbacteria bacterium CG_4_10_14_0_8_um_filter_39_9]|uniref:FAD-binding FR-type domain-containing protein n=1 Tax=Candidatus Roizmanbacteria bacterium CG_4_10_14_0_8_um_filter_39_9 TaxID=1974829 RepID=A0A2M7QCN4_9BACT|nr:MAG: hypothetical protein COY90_03050 [Candidatus Roizmanbacteria bacterium CG_4_10_14_0_8_um_filter_39_9]